MAAMVRSGVLQYSHMSPYRKLFHFYHLIPLGIWLGVGFTTDSWLHELANQNMSKNRNNSIAIQSEPDVSSSSAVKVEDVQRNPKFSMVLLSLRHGWAGCLTYLCIHFILYTIEKSFLHNCYLWCDVWNLRRIHIPPFPSRNVSQSDSDSHTPHFLDSCLQIQSLRQFVFWNLVWGVS